MAKRLLYKGLNFTGGFTVQSIKMENGMVGWGQWGTAGQPSMAPRAITRGQCLVSLAGHSSNTQTHTTGPFVVACVLSTACFKCSLCVTVPKGTETLCESCASLSSSEKHDVERESCGS